MSATECEKRRKARQKWRPYTYVNGVSVRTMARRTLTQLSFHVHLSACARLLTAKPLLCNVHFAFAEYALPRSDASLPEPRQRLLGQLAARGS